MDEMLRLSLQGKTHQLLMMKSAWKPKDWWSQTWTMKAELPFHASVWWLQAYPATFQGLNVQIPRIRFSWKFILLLYRHLHH